MALQLTLPAGTRTKSSITNPLVVGIDAITPSYNDSTDSIIYRYAFNDLNPPSFTVATCTTVNASPTVTTAVANGFASVKPGDAITGTGIPAATTVLSVESATSLTLSANATAAGTVTLTIDPPQFDATLLAMQLEFSLSGSTLSVTATFRNYSGVNAFDANGNGDDDLPFADSSTVGSPQVVTLQSIEVDSFLTNARVPRAV